VDRRVLALGLLGVGGALAYLVLARRKPVVEASAPGTGTAGLVEVDGPATSSRYSVPRCTEVAPGRYVCESPFREGQEVVIRTSEGEELRGRVIQVEPEPPSRAFGVPQPVGAGVGLVYEVARVVE